MSLVQKLGPHLPFLRRYARALTGKQKSGDSYVKAALQALASGDTELENQAENNFEKIMLDKWRDQEMARMAAASDQAEIPRSSLV